MKTLITTEKSLIMLPLASPFFPRDSDSVWRFPLSFFLYVSPSRSIPRLTRPSVSRLFRDANYVKYSHDTRMLLQDHGLTVVPVDDSLNYSQRFPLRFHLRGFASLAVGTDEISKQIEICMSLLVN